MTRKTLCFDSKKCVGCYACTVACMDQNDIDVVSDGLMYRHIAYIESKQAGEVRIVHVSAITRSVSTHVLQGRSVVTRTAERFSFVASCASVAMHVRWLARSAFPVSVATAPCRNAMHVMPARASAAIQLALRFAPRAR